MDKDNVLNMLISLADGISGTFGKSCETVIHEIKGQSYKIVYINNKEVSGRKIGSTTSLIGYDYLLNDFYKGKNLINYNAVTSKGKLIKSTTLHFKGPDYHYSLGINYDYTVFSMMEDALKGLIRTGSEYEEIFVQENEINLNELFDECVRSINTPIQLMNKEQRIKLIEMLDKKSAFTIKNSIVEVAKRLGISRYTIYNYLKEIRDTK